MTIESWIDVTEYGSEFKVEVDGFSNRRRVVGRISYDGIQIMTFRHPIMLPDNAQTQSEINRYVLELIKVWEP